MLRDGAALPQLVYGFVAPPVASSLPPPPGPPPALLYGLVPPPQPPLEGLVADSPEVEAPAAVPTELPNVPSTPEADAVALGKKTVVELRQSLSQRGLKSTGRKAELVARLLKDGDARDAASSVTDLAASLKAADSSACTA
jgi:hypothetical protein